MTATITTITRTLNNNYKNKKMPNKEQAQRE